MAFTKGPNIIVPNASTTMSSQPSQFTYANVSRPSRDQAVVIDSIEGLTNDDYLDGIETLTSINNVRNISKTSGGRVCVCVCI